MLSSRVENAAGDALRCSLYRAEGEPRCWSVFTASAERKGGRARADDLEGVQRQGPRLGEVPQGDPATAYLFLHFYFFFILFHSTAFISLSSQFRRTSTPALFPTNASHCIICWQAFLRVEMPPCSLSAATQLDYKSSCWSLHGCVYVCIFFKTVNVFWLIWDTKGHINLRRHNLMTLMDLFSCTEMERLAAAALFLHCRF